MDDALTWGRGAEQSTRATARGASKGPVPPMPGLPAYDEGKTPGEMPVKTASFSVTLNGDRDVLDLANILVSLKGVAAVKLDAGTDRVDVEYDPGFASEGQLRNCVQHSGYPIAGPETSA